MNITSDTTVWQLFLWIWVPFQGTKGSLTGVWGWYKAGLEMPFTMAVSVDWVSVKGLWGRISYLR